MREKSSLKSPFVKGVKNHLLEYVIIGLSRSNDITYNSGENTMLLDRKSYVWIYDRIHCRYYNLLIKFYFLPFLGEEK